MNIKSWGKQRSANPGSGAHGAEGFQAARGGFQFRKSAAFLFDQVVFNSASILGGGKNLFPWRHAFPKQHVITLLRRPVLAVHGANAAWIFLDPSDRVVSG